MGSILFVGVTMPLLVASLTWLGLDLVTPARVCSGQAAGLRAWVVALPLLVCGGVIIWRACSIGRLDFRAGAEAIISTICGAALEWIAGDFWWILHGCQA